MKTLLLGAAALGFTAAALALPAAAQETGGEQFVLISHAPDSDSWWNTIRNAIALASEELNVTVDYRNPPTGDLADMARIVEQSTAAQPDGIIVTIADFNVLSGPIRAAVDQGIPVITINSGTSEQSAELGALMHVGQPEHEAGRLAGVRAKEAGATSFVCVNHYITNPASVERCQGFAEGLGIELGNQMLDTGLDPAQVQNAVSAYLTANPQTDAILALGPNSAEPTIRAVTEQGLGGDDIVFATFDLSPAIAQAIRDETIDFAIDQQPFLQGYLPVVFLANYARYGVIPSNDVNSGPGFITADNLDQVEALAGTYR
jgi:simple sugar transport system substrate-binding protein